MTAEQYNAGELPSDSQLKLCEQAFKRTFYLLLAQGFDPGHILAGMLASILAEITTQRLDQTENAEHPLQKSSDKLPFADNSASSSPDHTLADRSLPLHSNPVHSHPTHATP